MPYAGVLLLCLSQRPRQCKRAGPTRQRHNFVDKLTKLCSGHFAGLWNGRGPGSQGSLSQPPLDDAPCPACSLEGVSFFSVG